MCLISVEHVTFLNYKLYTLSLMHNKMKSLSKGIYPINPNSLSSVTGQ